MKLNLVSSLPASVVAAPSASEVKQNSVELNLVSSLPTSLGKETIGTLSGNDVRVFQNESFERLISSTPRSAIDMPLVMTTSNMVTDSLVVAIENLHN